MKYLPKFAAVVAIAGLSASASFAGNSHRHHGHQWNRASHGWATSNVSGRFGDPSYNSNNRFRQSPYRCTEDLGYGRFEYCDAGK